MRDNAKTQIPKNTVQVRQPGSGAVVRALPGPANASGHCCSAPMVADMSQHGQAAHRPTVAAGRTWGPPPGSGRG